MLNGRQLRILFQRFNAQYFDGRLPSYSIRLVPSITWLGEGGHCDRERRRIRIRAAQSDEETISTLLHEMVHARTGDSHDAGFKREMVRLSKAGAPLTAGDLEFSSKDWHAGRVTKALFRSVVEDALNDVPDLTLHRAVRHFIYDTGAGEVRTVAEFLRRYPWSRQVFQAAKRARVGFAT